MLRPETSDDAAPGERSLVSTTSRSDAMTSLYYLKIERKKLKRKRRERQWKIKVEVVSCHTNLMAYWKGKMREKRVGSVFITIFRLFPLILLFFVPSLLLFTCDLLAPLYFLCLKINSVEDFFFSMLQTYTLLFSVCYFSPGERLISSLLPLVFGNGLGAPLHLWALEACLCRNVCFQVSSLLSRFSYFKVKQKERIKDRERKDGAWASHLWPHLINILYLYCIYIFLCLNFNDLNADYTAVTTWVMLFLSSFLLFITNCMDMSE